MGSKKVKSIYVKGLNCIKIDNFAIVIDPNSETLEFRNNNIFEIAWLVNNKKDIKTYYMIRKELKNIKRFVVNHIIYNNEFKLVNIELNNKIYKEISITELYNILD